MLQNNAELAVLARLKEIRSQYKDFPVPGFQVKELAQYCQVSPRTINNWINGRTKPNQKKLMLITEWLNTRPKGEQYQSI